MKWRCRLGKAQTRPGLEQAAVSFFNDPVVHWYRNIFSHVPSTKVREIAAMLKAIHAGEDIAAAREKANRVIEKLRGLRLSRAAELVEAAEADSWSKFRNRRPRVGGREAMRHGPRACRGIRVVARRRRSGWRAATRSWPNAPIGGTSALRSVDLALAHRAAKLSMRGPRNAEDATRLANATSRLSAQCGLADRHRRLDRRRVNLRSRASRLTIWRRRNECRDEQAGPAAQLPGRRMWEEYKPGAKMIVEHDPVEDWIARAKMRYTARMWLVVYLNLNDYGIRQAETERAIAEIKQRHAGSFEQSLDGRGSWRDNVFLERFWRSVKYVECI
jgi:hypothetical protein